MMAVICTLDLQAETGFSLNQSRRTMIVIIADEPSVHVNSSHRHSSSVCRLFCLLVEFEFCLLVGSCLCGDAIGKVSIKELRGCQPSFNTKPDVAKTVPQLPKSKTNY